MKEYDWVHQNLGNAAIKLNHGMTCISNDVWHGAGAEAGEQVLKQQEQLAALARRHSRRPASTTDTSNDTPEPACPQIFTKNVTDMTADTSKPTDQATDSFPDTAGLKVSTLLLLLIHWRVSPSP